MERKGHLAPRCITFQAHFGRSRVGSVCFFSFHPRTPAAYFIFFFSETQTICAARTHISTLHAVSSVTEAPGKWIFSWKLQKNNKSKEEVKKNKTLLCFRCLPDKPSRTDNVRNYRGDAESVCRVGETTGVRSLGSARGVSVGVFTTQGIPSAQASTSSPSEEARRGLLLPQGRKHEPAVLCDSRNDPHLEASTRSAGSKGPSGEL